MNTRSLEQLQRLLTQRTDSESEEEPAEGSLLWAAEQLRRIARMLEDMQTGPGRPGDAVPPAPGAVSAAGPCAPGQWQDGTGHPLCTRSLQHPRSPLAPEARHVVQ